MPAPQKKIKKQSQQLDIGTGLTRSFGQGLLFGFADEAEAFGRSLVGSKSYKENLETIRSELDAFRKQAPVAAYGTEIAAAIPSTIFTGGTALLGRAGLKGAGKVGAAQSAIYGAGVGEDAESRAKGAMISAVTGGAASKGADLLLPKKSATAKKLQAKGIPLTPGQALRDSGSIGSDLISALEDLSTSYPGVGVPIQAKRLETLIKTNRLLLDEAVAPLKIKIPKGLEGREAFEYVDDIVSKEYENVINKLSLKNTSNLETRILNTIENSALDTTEQQKVLKLIDVNLINKIKDGKLLGRDLKNAQTALRQKAENFEKQGGFQAEIGQVLRETKHILEDEIDLQNINSGDLKRINLVYRNLVPITDAMQQAVIQEGVFTPAQLLRAIKKADKTKRKKQVIAGQAPLQQTAEEAQAILGSSFPDTGTASRLLAQGIIQQPSGLAGLSPTAFASSVIQARPFGYSPTTGILTAPLPVVKGVTPPITALTSSAIQEENNLNKPPK